MFIILTFYVYLLIKYIYYGMWMQKNYCTTKNRT